MTPTVSLRFGYLALTRPTSWRAEGQVTVLLQSPALSLLCLASDSPMLPTSFPSRQIDHPIRRVR